MFRLHQPDPGPERLGEILSRLFTVRGIGRRSARQQLEKAWADAVGAESSAKTRVLQIRRGVLEVEVADAILQQELSNFHKRRLLEQLRKTLPGTTLNDVRFKMGVWKK